MAFEFANAIKPFSLIVFFGGLGAGKTAFVYGFAKKFGVQDLVNSPTFSIINEYGYDNKLKIVHCDMYRIHTEEDLYSTGFFDFLGDEDVILLVEWGENVKQFLKDIDYEIEIKIIDDNKREIVINGGTN